MFSVFLLAVSFYEKEARSNICYFFWAAHCLRSFFYGAGNALPYPDPTPELIAYQDNNAKKAYIVFVVGLLISACGISWLRSLSKIP